MSLEAETIAKKFPRQFPRLVLLSRYAFPTCIMRYTSLRFMPNISDILWKYESTSTVQAKYSLGVLFFPPVL